MNTPHSVQDKVMERIRAGSVAMRPRWQFVLLASLWITGAILGLLVVLYLASLVVFMLRASGVWFAPYLGMRGWFDIFRSAPLYIIVLTAVCALLLNVLVRRFAFAYRRPLVLTLGGVLFVTFFGGILVGVSPFHREVHRQSRHGFLPPPIQAIYDKGLRPPLPDDMYRGTVVSKDGDFIVIATDDGATTSVHISKRTRLPFGEDFSAGDTLIVIGDNASGTIEAFGIIEPDQEIDLDDSSRAPEILPPPGM